LLRVEQSGGKLNGARFVRAFFVGLLDRSTQRRFNPPAGRDNRIRLTASQSSTPRTMVYEAVSFRSAAPFHSAPLGSSLCNEEYFIGNRSSSWT